MDKKEKQSLNKAMKNTSDYIERRVFIFDVDGTLTPSRQKMTEEFKEFFLKWSKGKKYYLVSGSNIEKMDEQVPEDIMIDAQGLFCCGGNELWEFDPHTVNFPYNRIYEHKFKPPNTLLTYLGTMVRLTNSPVMATNHREDRGSMLNFSVVGRDCTLEERQQYFEWDNEVGERKKIAKEINDGWPHLEAVIGGQISIDIAPKGNDKSQVIHEIMKRELEISIVLDNLPPHNKYIFIGDRTMEGGNDYPLAKVMDEMGDCDWYQAGEPSAEDGYKTTQKILEELDD